MASASTVRKPSASTPNDGELVALHGVVVEPKLAEQWTGGFLFEDLVLLKEDGAKNRKTPRRNCTVS